MTLQDNNIEASWGKRLLVTMVMNLIIPAVQIFIAYIPHSFEYLSSYFLRCTLAGSWVGEDHLTDSECQEVVFLGLGKAGLQ